jgi:hypothetical protein
MHFLFAINKGKKKITVQGQTQKKMEKWSTKKIKTKDNSKKRTIKRRKKGKK